PDSARARSHPRLRQPRHPRRQARRLHLEAVASDRHHPVMKPTPGRFAAALLAAALLVVTPAARADGDPASDVLISAPAFFSYTKLPEASTAALTRVVGAATRGGYTVRVATIGARFDLGSVPSFWQNPQPYAAFLSQELLGPAPYTNRVLVVMPNGFGLSRN